MHELTLRGECAAKRDWDKCIADSSQALRLGGCKRNIRPTGRRPNRQKMGPTIADYAGHPNPAEVAVALQRAGAKPQQERLGKYCADFTQVLELSPNDVTALSQRASPMVRKGELDKSIADCTQALKKCSIRNICPALINRSWAYNAKREWDKALTIT